MDRKTVTVQFPEELLAQIDEAALQLAKQGIVIKRSGVIRMLIERALTELYPYPVPKPEQGRTRKL
jgi:metal-responsive CopG/Arc/MetJ family transcriptional regulator